MFEQEFYTRFDRRKSVARHHPALTLKPGAPASCVARNGTQGGYRAARIALVAPFSFRDPMGSKVAYQPACGKLPVWSSAAVWRSPRSWERAFAPSGAASR